MIYRIVPVAPAGSVTSYSLPTRSCAFFKNPSTASVNSLLVILLKIVFIANEAYVPISYNTAFRAPHTGVTFRLFAISFMRFVGCSHNRAATPVLPLPAKASNTTSPGLVVQAI